MPQLTKAIETEPKLIVTECVTTAELLLGGYSNFELVLCPRIRYDLPIVLPIHEWSIGQHGSEQVIILLQKCMSVVRGECDLFR
jgi:hypothetical protein